MQSIQVKFYYYGITQSGLHKVYFWNLQIESLKNKVLNVSAHFTQGKSLYNSSAILEIINSSIAPEIKPDRFPGHLNWPCFWRFWRFWRHHHSELHRTHTVFLGECLLLFLFIFGENACIKYNISHKPLFYLSYIIWIWKFKNNFYNLKWFSSILFIWKNSQL